LQTESATRPEADTTPIGGDELAEGLMLVRASTLKMIRLQLAMERRDRRVAIEAVDDLVALDRRLQQYLDEVPAVHEPLLLKREIESERAALNHERLTLAAGVIGAAPRSWEQPQSVIEPPPAAESATDAPASDKWQPAWEEVADAPRRRRWWKAAVALFLPFAFAAGAYLFMSTEALTRLIEAAGGVP
jgi:hypothetical protein